MWAPQRHPWQSGALPGPQEEGPQDLLEGPRAPTHYSHRQIISLGHPLAPLLGLRGALLEVLLGDQMLSGWRRRMEVRPMGLEEELGDRRDL